VLVLVSQSLFADENPGKPAKEKLSAAAASEASSTDATKLPIRRVVLYKNGVGYFQHFGRVRGSQDVHIDFTSAQLNDVLKSLTVLDLSGGRITGVDYNSEAPLARRLATLRLALGERPTVMDFLGALRGARVEVRNGTGAAITGKILSVERKTRMGTAGSVEMEQISLITDAGEVHNLDLNTWAPSSGGPAGERSAFTADSLGHSLGRKRSLERPGNRRKRRVRAWRQCHSKKTKTVGSSRKPTPTVMASMRSMESPPEATVRKYSRLASKKTSLPP